jgi:(2R)-3-sulfolactate dehydrogenase (NADP+)
LVIDPGALAGRESYYARLEVLINEMLSDNGVRLAGERRAQLLRQSQAAGISVPQAQLDILERLGV